jgi:hypothetical protein
MALFVRARAPLDAGAHGRATPTRNPRFAIELPACFLDKMDEVSTSLRSSARRAEKNGVVFPQTERRSRRRRSTW